MMEELGLLDVWHSDHPKEIDFTFMSQVHVSYSRIEFFFSISKKDIYRVKESKIEPVTISDHVPVTLKIYLR